MRALAHPLRLRIREILDDEGPLTATQLSERIGESPANCSFHLRTLAKYGFIEEAEGGTGRNRPWQTRRGTMHVAPEKLTGDAKRAAVAMSDALRTALFRRIERWAHRHAEQLPKPWRTVGFEMEYDTTLSPAELKRVGEQIGEILRASQTSRTDGKEPADTRRVTIAVQGFPHVPED